MANEGEEETTKTHKLWTDKKKSSYHLKYGASAKVDNDIKRKYLVVQWWAQNNKNKGKVVVGLSTLEALYGRFSTTADAMAVPESRQRGRDREKNRSGLNGGLFIRAHFF